MLRHSRTGRETDYARYDSAMNVIVSLSIQRLLQLPKRAKCKIPLRVNFNKRFKQEFDGSNISSAVGPPPLRDLEDAVRLAGLSEKILRRDISVAQGSNQSPYAVHNEHAYDQTDDRSNPIHRSPSSSGGSRVSRVNCREFEVSIARRYSPMTTPTSPNTRTTDPINAATYPTYFN